MYSKIMKNIFKYIFTFTILFILFPSSVRADDCTPPDSVGTKSVGRDVVTVGWEYDVNEDAPSNDYSFTVSYNKAGEDPSTPYTINSDGTSYEYTHNFTSLEEDTIYYWTLTVNCEIAGVPTSNSNILKGFKTTPTLDITGFLFVNGTIDLHRRIKVISDFSYFRTPIFDLLTNSVGSGRLHVIDIY